MWAGLASTPPLVLAEQLVGFETCISEMASATHVIKKVKMLKPSQKRLQLRRGRTFRGTTTPLPPCVVCGPHQLVRTHARSTGAVDDAVQ
jgi:hypothetical protein